MAACGSRSGYDLGCRCGDCRSAKNAAAREYTARRRERDGVSQYAQYARAKAEAEGRVYVPEAERMMPCAVCGAEVLKRDPASAVPAMHRACRNSAEGRQAAYRAEGRPSRRMAAFRRKMERAARGRPATKRVFVQGACGWCGASFCAPFGAFCSDACKMRAKKARVRPMDFNPTPALRREVYERDGWGCGLCGLPIDPARAWPDKWCASLDHVVPQSHMLIPDHSALNLRAVHLHCNSMRGDGSNMPEDVLRVRARELQGVA